MGELGARAPARPFFPGKFKIKGVSHEVGIEIANNNVDNIPKKCATQSKSEDTMKRFLHLLYVIPCLVIIYMALFTGPFINTLELTDEEHVFGYWSDQGWFPSTPPEKKVTLPIVDGNYPCDPENIFSWLGQAVIHPEKFNRESYNAMYCNTED